MSTILALTEPTSPPWRPVPVRSDWPKTWELADPSSWRVELTLRADGWYFQRAPGAYLGPIYDHTPYGPYATWKDAAAAALD